MIDLHCHYLFGVDDGADTIEQSLNLARASVLDGITHAVLTPHIYPGRWDNTLTTLLPAFIEFSARLKEEQIQLSISLGAEVHLLPESLELVGKGLVPFVGSHNGSNVMLLEMPDGQIPVGAMQAVEFLLARNVTPMIVHPERNKDVMRKLRRIEPFVEAGCLLQLTAASVCGRFGNYAHRCALEILEQGWAFAVASDAHNLAHRPPVMSEAREALNERYGAAAGDLLTKVNPGGIIAGLAEQLPAQQPPA